MTRSLPKLVLCALASALASCGPTTHRFHGASFVLPETWSQVASPNRNAFTAVDATRDGYDLFMVVHQPHRADPATIPAAGLDKTSSNIAEKSLALLKSNPAYKNVRLLSRRIGKVGGIPVMEQVVAAHTTWPGGQSGPIVMSHRMYAVKGAVYNFSLRESEDSHRKDPGYFKRLVDTARIE